MLQVLSAEDSEAQGSSVLSRTCLSELTNEESVDDRSPSHERNSMISDSSSSSSNDTLKLRGSLVQMSADEHDDSVTSHSARSSIMLLGTSIYVIYLLLQDLKVMFLQVYIGRQGGLVVRGAGHVIWRPQAQVQFQGNQRFLNSQLICLPPVGIF